MLAFLFVIIFTKCFRNPPNSHKMIWPWCDHVLLLIINWIWVSAQGVNYSTMTLESHYFLTIFKLEDFNSCCVFVRTRSKQVISDKLYSKTTQSVRFQLVNHLFRNLTMIFVSIKLHKLLLYLRLLVLLSLIFSRYKLVNVLLVFLFLIKNSLWILVIINQMIFWFLWRNQLNS